MKNDWFPLPLLYLASIRSDKDSAWKMWQNRITPRKFWAHWNECFSNKTSAARTSPSDFTFLKSLFKDILKTPRISAAQTFPKSSQSQWNTTKASKPLLYFTCKKGICCLADQWGRKSQCRAWDAWYLCEVYWWSTDVFPCRLMGTWHCWPAAFQPAPVHSQEQNSQWSRWVPSYFVVS